MVGVNVVHELCSVILPLGRTQMHDVDASSQCAIGDRGLGQDPKGSQLSAHRQSQEPPFLCVAPQWGVVAGFSRHKLADLLKFKCFWPNSNGRSACWRDAIALCAGVQDGDIFHCIIEWRRQ